MRGRHKCVLHSFSLNHGFIPLSFPGKVFNEADYDTKGCCTLFPSLKFFPTGFFSSKVLMRYILDGHPRGSVMNIISGCPQTLVLISLVTPYYLSAKSHLFVLIP